MTSRPLLRHPSAFLPVVLSLGALAVVLAALALHGPAPQADEGIAAHLWQALMALQIPLVGYFAFTELARSPRRALPILGLQGAAALAALVPVALLGW